MTGEVVNTLLSLDWQWQPNSWQGFPWHLYQAGVLQTGSHWQTFGCSGFQVEDLEPGLEQQTGVSSGWSDYGAFGTELWHGFHDLCCPPPIVFIWRTKKKQAVGISKFKTLKKTSTIKWTNEDVWLRAVFTWLSKVIEELVWFWFWFVFLIGSLK